MAHQCNAVLQQFGEKLGIAGLCFDEYNSCLLMVDDISFNLQLKEELNTLLIYCPLKKLDEQSPREVLLHLLEANCLGSGTHGLQLGLEKNMQVLILSGSLSTHCLSPVELERFVQFFVDEARRWNTELHSTPEAEKPEDIPYPTDMLRI
ncbi:MAG: type III secretion system chaperone [Desulfovibrionaceae bacterium]|nr:type III secretion system chaperone [Desulfovibrionaceae bacterium]